MWHVTYDLRMALLKVEADVNVFPSRYLFSPLILNLVFRSSSSALSTNGLSEACQFKQRVLSLLDANKNRVLVLYTFRNEEFFTMIHPQVSA